MLNWKEQWDMPQPLDKLATDMFRTFARFEFALKAAGFHNGDGPAEPNWRSFAETIPALFNSPGDPDLKAAVDFILGRPSRKQIIANGVLTWSDPAPDTDLLSDRLLIYVRRVRNNLFLGGKFNGHWFEPERSELLLSLLARHFTRLYPRIK